MFLRLSDVLVDLACSFDYKFKRGHIEITVPVLIFLGDSSVPEESPTAVITPSTEEVCRKHPGM
jgi:hypothetical protein